MLFCRNFYLCLISTHCLSGFAPNAAFVSILVISFIIYNPKVQKFISLSSCLKWSEIRSLKKKCCILQSIGILCH